MTKNHQSEHIIASLLIIYCSDGHHFEFLAIAAKQPSLSHNKNDFLIQQMKIHKKNLLVQNISQKPQRKT